MSLQPKYGMHSTLNEHPQQPTPSAPVCTDNVACQQVLSCAQSLLLVALA